jgi:hypothetical protein
MCTCRRSSPLIATIRQQLTTDHPRLPSLTSLLPQSWDRQPFLTSLRDGTPSLLPAWNELHHNLVISNYNADGGCFDNDDGSAW